MAAIQLKPTRIILSLLGLLVLIWILKETVYNGDVVFVGGHRISLKKPKGQPFIEDPLMKLNGPPEGIKLYGPGESERVNATLLSLVRNSELSGMLQAMIDLERTFNKKFNYPWTFINDEPFTEHFKERTQKMTKSKCSYHVIPKEHWEVPSWINEDLRQESEQLLSDQKVAYSDVKSYHQMCRWNSGMFYKHPALKDFKWYWRVEPKVRFFCDIDYDVFRYMQDANKTYGFVINIYDSPESIASLWPAVEEFMAEHPEYIHPNNALAWLTDSETRPDKTKTANGYSTCHFWSNFEIGNLDFWRSKRYDEFFNHLDRTGGFFYERWGDAPVHSVALGLMEDKNKIHWFRDIGYSHYPYLSCPNSQKCRGCEPGKFTTEGGLHDEDCRVNWFKYAHMD